MTNLKSLQAEQPLSSLPANTYSENGVKQDYACIHKNRTAWTGFRLDCTPTGAKIVIRMELLCNLHINYIIDQIRCFWRFTVSKSWCSISVIVPACFKGSSLKNEHYVLPFQTCMSDPVSSVGHKRRTPLDPIYFYCMDKRNTETFFNISSFVLDGRKKSYRFGTFWVLLRYLYFLGG